MTFLWALSVIVVSAAFGYMLLNAKDLFVYGEPRKSEDDEADDQTYSF